MRDLTLENPIRAIREVSHDITGRRKVRLANGKEAARWRSSRSTSRRPREFVERRGGDPAPSGSSTCGAGCSTRSRPATCPRSTREIDWVTKLQLIERYQAKHDLPLSHPRIAQMDLAYHDLRRGRGLYALLERKGAVDRVATDLEIFEAKETPPQTTRARLRGEFIRHAQEKRRDFTVDWVHLKLNDQAQRTVLCKDPFRAYDERVERLIACM